MLTAEPGERAPAAPGRRLRRLTPRKHAVMAARMSTASSPSRNTMIAALVMTVASDAPSRRASRRRPRAPSSSASRVALTSAPRRAAGDELGEPGVAERAEPDQALDVGGQRRVERVQPALRARTRRSRRARRASARPGGTAGGDLLLEPVERDLDEVEVALVGLLLPGVGVQRGEPLAERLGLRLDRVDLRHRRRPLLRGAQHARRAPRRRALDVGGRGGVDRGQRALQVGEAPPARRSRTRAPPGSRTATVTRVPSTPWSYSTGIERDELRELVRAARLLLRR